MRKTMITMTLATLLTACATTTGTQPDVRTSGFDQAKIVEIQPHGASCGSAGCLGLGAQWNESHGDNAFFIVTSYMDYVAILDAQLNIDGQVIDLEPADVVTDFDSQYGKVSSKGFRTNLDTIEAITKADRVWLRIKTPNGTREDRIIDQDGDSKAYHAMKRFMNSVRGTR
ncbi:hypothetical protein CWE08_07450 [Aliidiomarina iranensis]|uniref:Lipoprotein n=1 Tax=Aliidiomarina iranensis TaxID=1434071 RepID=A0A432VWG5_9GAMM|nr:hypothetical protein [Aliidiomarina iranensis]RUO20927.1 hypothetical protein CWE08_07450 [Aliidiomarina iranensis]